jgi:deoxyribonuclease-4
MPDEREETRRLGVHTSIAGGVPLSLDRARKLRCSTMQIFSHNPRGWARRAIGKSEADEFRRLSEEYDIKPVFVHSSYLINLASPDSVIRKKSVRLLVFELRMAELLGIDHVVLHPGKAAGQPVKEAIDKTVRSLREVRKMTGSRSGILLENTAGQRGDISSLIPSIGGIVEGSPPGLIRGLCLDTCHAYAAGYNIADREDLERLRDEIKRYLSPLKVELVHLNDSKKGLSSGVDRHEHIGKGEIGRKGLRRFLSSSFLGEVPLVLETPKASEGDDIKNLAKVRKMLTEISQHRANKREHTGRLSI